jgi:DNA-binding Xre family transcriptional regulator
MLYINLQPIFKARGIDRPHTFLVNAGIPSHTAHKFLEGSYRQPRLDNIEVICAALNCTPHDILVYIPDTNNPLPAQHPLHKLNKQATNFNLHESFKNIPIEQLNQITDILNNLNQNNNSQKND